MVTILYLAHDLDDTAVWRRVSMLEAGGAQVTLAGFRRGTAALPGPAHVLAMTSNGRMGQRLWAVARAVVGAKQSFGDLPRPDVILARNLEMLAVARRVRGLWRGRAKPGLAYEVLDIHRMMLGGSVRARVLRAVERGLTGSVGTLLTSSPGFIRNYFVFHGQIDTKTPVQIVENKVNDLDLASGRVDREQSGRAVPTIGWFGILRCAASLAVLDEVTRASPGRIKVLLAGRPALDAIPDFPTIVTANPDFEFVGPYRNPDDLPRLYGAVDLAWLIDRYDAGLNSDWLLPNRLYEGCLFGAVPLALSGTEVAHQLAPLDIGLELPRLTARDLSTLIADLTRDGLAREAGKVAAVSRDRWVANRVDAVSLVTALAMTAARTGDAAKHQPQGPADARTVTDAATPDATRGPVLVVIPTLNEAAHIAQVIDSLLPFARRTGARIIVVDGGSDDGTQATVATRTTLGQPVFLVHNPARLQAAGINLAVDMHGADAAWLIRVDAHADYPQDYCDILLAEAARHSADSVVVGMEAVGQGLWQTAVAAAQNSRFGNGGAAHRVTPVGKFVEHGHHALMRMAMFRAVGGYDPAFSHNEDAELDVRLRAKGARIWLTAATRLAYFPRRSVPALVRQYFRFGRGRAQNILKHKNRPGPRQMLVILLAPSMALAVLAPISWLFAMPVIVWAAACLGAGVVIARATGDARSLLAGLAAGAMHAAWSAGFWVRLIGLARRPTVFGAKR